MKELNNFTKSGRQEIRWVFGAALLMTSSCSAQPVDENPIKPPLDADQPNIIFILADDMGYGDIHRFNPGSAIPTPHLDKLSAQGMMFTEAHSGSALSTPTRYGLLTGRYSFRSSLKKGVLGGFSKPLIEKDRPTIASLLKSRGYHTAIIGKWHLGLGWQTTDGSEAEENNTAFDKPLTYTPNDAGFDKSYILPASLDMVPYVYIEDRNVVDPIMTVIEGVDSPRGHFWRTGKASQSFSIEKTLDHFTNKAKQYIRERSSSKQPFFLYMPLTAPHTPWLPADKFKGVSGAGDYGDFVVHVDDVVGQVTSLIDSLGIKEKTLIVFTSDNGADWNSTDKAAYPHLANYIFRGRKSDAWEGGHHIPLIIQYPKVISSGKTSDALVCMTDFFATFAETTGANTPLWAAEDSKSFLQVLNGSSKTSRSEVIHHSGDGYFAIRQGRWKFIDCSGSGGWSSAEKETLPPGQLYDMQTDPEEKNNLYDKYPQKVEELKKLLNTIIR